MSVVKVLILLYKDSNKCLTEKVKPECSFNYTENNTGLRLSPCGVPMLLTKGLSFVAPLILVLMTVSLKRKRIILSSSSSTMRSIMSSKICLSIVSKAADMSIPVILISTSSFLALAASHLCVHATSDVFFQAESHFGCEIDILQCSVLFCEEL